MSRGPVIAGGLIAMLALVVIVASLTAAQRRQTDGKPPQELLSLPVTKPAVIGRYQMLAVSAVGTFMWDSMTSECWRYNGGEWVSIGKPTDIPVLPPNPAPN